ncbi:MAG TPA: zinc-ribbon domain-containing protein, partial [Bacteroidetes bacterium]|nr:zinc-ribbon domain-containing protein [Bacteroidota bacterium]
MIYCIKCKSELPARARFCPVCGTPVIEEPFVCPECHTENPMDA